ncbi:lem3 cdc50 family protein [Colletotrichum incanum]|uniref:Lem3 cdc50 family protein n=1 Tax=Colletotrichum incanum TaxID=1573173 RepID=A0A166WG38_COLIC|nr:lem3 cdc50 family protein [Colletotrichum incanum]
MAMFWRDKKMSEAAKNERPLRRPKDTPLNQQRMRAWQPVFTHGTSIKAFLALGIMFLAIGGFWITGNKKISEIRFDYTKCHEIDLEDEPELMPSENIKQRFKASSTGHPLAQWKRSSRPLTFDGVTKNYTLCTIDFFLPDDLQPPVLFYYQLTNFHQNHRKYVTSLDERQLKGKSVTRDSIESTCFPVISSRSFREGDRGQDEDKVIYPCGAIANSFFNDTFANPQRFPAGFDPDSNQLITCNMLRTGIASENEKLLFKPTTYPIPLEPNDSNGTVIVPPPNWSERFPNGYHSGNMFNPADDEAFMVWMRTAASPNFAKLIMRNDKQVMERGMYRLQAFSHFPTHMYGGTKSIIISTTSSGMKRNDFLGISSMASGAISITLAAVVALSVLHKQQALNDHDYLHQ